MWQRFTLSWPGSSRPSTLNRTAVKTWMRGSSPRMTVARPVAQEFHFSDGLSFVMAGFMRLGGNERNMYGDAREIIGARNIRSGQS
jgi:hypothetical protein